MPRVLEWLRRDLAASGRLNLWPRAGKHFGCTKDALRRAVTAGRWRNEWLAMSRVAGSAAPTRVAGSSSSPATGVPHRSLDQYLLDKRKSECPVCKLHPDIRAILKRASEKGSARVAEQVEWLRVDCGAAVTGSELTTHRAGGHET